MSTSSQPDLTTPPPSGDAPRRQKKVVAPPPARNSTPIALGMVALALGLLALVVTVLNVTGLIGRSGGGVATGTCERTAWAALPRPAELPDGWSVQTPEFEISRVSAALVGQAAADGTTTAVYVKVTCYDTDSSEALQRTKVSNIENGATVDVLRTGDEGFTFDDPASSSFGAYFRRGNLVASLLLSSDTPQTELDSAVVALDTAMQRAQSIGGLSIPAAIAPTPGPSLAADASSDPNATPGASEPAATPAAPDLEALLPSTVNGTELTKTSYTAADVFEGDTSPGARAIVAALAQKGKKTTDFFMADAQDPNGVLPLMISAFKVTGLDITTFEPVILQTVFNTGVAGVTTTEQTVGGKKVKVIDFGDGGEKYYAYITGDALIVLSTTDPAIAATILSGLK